MSEPNIKEPVLSASSACDDNAAQLRLALELMHQISARQGFEKLATLNAARAATTDR